ncbi:MAG: hypothetical protein LBE85_06840 [Candidatus Accumulibacter sp.]|jgi:hypothetical protein|nr:hypothetical protein [Accumulibacter sp.]
MNTPSPSLPWKEQRRRKIVFAATMLLLLAASVLFFFFAQQRLRRSEAEALLEARALQEALLAEAEALNRKRLDERARELLDGAARRGLLPENWAGRRINLRQANLPREEVNDLIFSLARTDQRFFQLEEFEVAATRDEDGLFSLPVRANAPLSVTVQGTLIFQTKSGSR